MAGIADISVGGAVDRSVGSTPAVKIVGVDHEFVDSKTGVAQRVLRDVSLEVGSSELLALVGKSGCGKTTILNLVAGLYPPTSGSVTVLGESSPESARKRVGYMFARDALVPWRRAIQNVALGLELRGVARTERLEMARRQLAAVGLGDAESKYPAQLSQGMRQRVALARTWAMDASLLLMDEPFAALDALTRAEVQARFLHMWEMKRTSVLFVTHDLAEAALLADRILLLSDGCIAREVRVPFERPRDLLALRKDERYNALLGELMEGLGLASDY